MRFTESASNFRPHGCRDSTGDPPKRGQEFHSRRESEHYISARTRIQALEEEWAISFKLPGRIDILPKTQQADERVDWHTSICPQHASLYHHSLIGRLPRRNNSLPNRGC